MMELHSLYKTKQEAVESDRRGPIQGQQTRSAVGVLDFIMTEAGA